MKLIVHIGIISFLIYISIISKPGSSLFSMHPFCMALAYAVFMTEGVLIFTNKSLLSSKTPRSLLIYYHWMLNTIAGVSSIIGFIFIYWNKNRKGLEHFLTNHACYGLCCVIYTILQLVAGLFLKYKSLIPRWIKVGTVKKLHSLSGVASYGLGVIALILSFSSNWYMKSGYPLMNFVFTALLIIISVILLDSVLSKHFGINLWQKKVKKNL